MPYSELDDALGRRSLGWDLLPGQQEILDAHDIQKRVADETKYTYSYSPIMVSAAGCLVSMIICLLIVSCVVLF